MQLREKSYFSFLIYFLTYIAIYCKFAIFSEVQTSPPLSHFLDRNAFPDSTEHWLRTTLWLSKKCMIHNWESASLTLISTKHISKEHSYKNTLGNVNIKFLMLLVSRRGKVYDTSLGKKICATIDRGQDKHWVTQRCVQLKMEET